MTNQEQLRQFQSLLDNAQIVLIMYGSNPSHDELAAAGALQHSLRSSGKEVSVYAPSTPEKRNGNQIIGSTKTEIGHQNLVISFDYSEEAVDKVSYHIGEDTNKFFLTIKPKRGYEPLESKSVEFSYTGAEADLILLVGVQDLESLEQLYFGYEDLYRNTPLVSFNTFPSKLGTINFGDSSAAISESAADLIKSLGMSINSEYATELLQGLEESTDNLQSLEVTADTFETAAFLLRSGAVRQRDYSSSEYQVSGWKDKEAAETEMKVVRQDKSEQTPVKEKKEDKSNKSTKSKQQASQQNRPEPGRGLSKK